MNWFKRQRVARVPDRPRRRYDLSAIPAELLVIEPDQEIKIIIVTHAPGLPQLDKEIITQTLVQSLSEVNVDWQTGTVQWLVQAEVLPD